MQKTVFFYTRQMGINNYLIGLEEKFSLVQLYFLLRTTNFFVKNWKAVKKDQKDFVMFEQEKWFHLHFCISVFSEEDFKKREKGSQKVINLIVAISIMEVEHKEQKLLNIFSSSLSVQKGFKEISWLSYLVI